MKILKAKYILNKNVLKKASSIAIQGYKGSFHQEAAEKYFGKNIDVVYTNTFKDLVRLADSSNLYDAAVMAIENSIAGSILSNYTLIRNSNLTIVGEVYLKINQYLLANPGVTLQDIRQVYSHPMAIQQSLEFLKKYDWHLIETNDTALSAKFVHDNKHKHIAAIASKLAAKLYKLDILASNIQTLKNNYTRFLVLQTGNAQAMADTNKASLYFRPKQLTDNLSGILAQIVKKQISLTSLQAVAIPGTNFESGYHIDVEFASLDYFNNFINKIKSLTSELKVCGLYKAAKRPLEAL